MCMLLKINNKLMELGHAVKKKSILVKFLFGFLFYKTCTNRNSYGKLRIILRSLRLLDIFTIWH